jgi:hypothetical protein
VWTQRYYVHVAHFALPTANVPCRPNDVLG